MSITICDVSINVDKDNPNIEPFINGTTTTLISGDLDVSCTILSGECNKSFCDDRGIINQRNYQIRKQNFNLQRETNNTYRPDIFTAAADNTKREAGAKFITTFPSYCQKCSGFSRVSNSNEYPKCDADITLEDNLLNKKAYMFKSRLNNVISGPIINYTNTGVKSAVLFGGNTGIGLTRNQQLSNIGRGLLPNGRKGLKFGVQSLEGISLYSNSNIYNSNPNGVYGATVVRPAPLDRRFASRSIPALIPICQR